MAGDVNSLTAKYCATAGWQLGDDDFVGGILLRITLSFGEKMPELNYFKNKLTKIRYYISLDILIVSVRIV